VLRKICVLVSVVSIVGVAAPAAAPAESAESNLEFVTNVPFGRGTHLEFMERDGRTYALAGSEDGSHGGLFIVDVTDGENPVLTGHARCPSGGNMDIASFPERNLLVTTIDANFSGSTGTARGCTVPSTPGYKAFFTQDLVFIDATDLTNPVVLGTPSSLPALKGIHTIVRHPTEPIAYLSNQETPDRGPVLSILDLSDPDPTKARAVHVDMPKVGSGPHDITFNADGTRAYVSAVTASYILDTTNPFAPTVVAHIVDPMINIHHEAILAPNGRHLFIIDELSGAAVNPQCPGGGVHIYDLTVEAAPVKVGVFFATDTSNYLDVIASGDPELPVCTAHEGNFSADGTRLILGWYRGGARVFDTSAVMNQSLPPGAPVLQVSEVGFATRGGAELWAAKAHPNVPGYAFGTNQHAGLDVFRVTGAAA
jgi:hypothetical protein